MASGTITSWQIDGETMKKVRNVFVFIYLFIYLFIFLGGSAPKSLQMVIAALKLKDNCSLEEKLWPT